MLREIREDPDRGFFCLDWDADEPFEIYGSEMEDNYQRIEALLAPCNSINTELGVEGLTGYDSVDQDCNPSLTDQITYMRESQVLLLVNQERFSPEEFGRDSIEQMSLIIQQQFDKSSPNFIITEALLSELQDETSIVQYGQEDATEFVSLSKSSPQPSSWTQHPSFNSTGLYKFTSVEVNLE